MNMNKDDKKHENDIEMKDENETKTPNTEEYVPWTAKDDVQICNVILKHLKSIKVDAKANKKEQATLNYKNIKEVFIDDEKFEDDFRKFYKQMDANYKKWLSYDRKAFKLNSVKDMDGLIKMVENIKSDRMTK